MPASRYPISVSQYGPARGQTGLDDDEEDDDDDSLSQSGPQDRVRRNYLGQQPASLSAVGSLPDGSMPGATGRPETIKVQLNESYFSAERRRLYNLLATVRSKLSSMQMFNPVKNQTMREQQETWDEKVSNSGGSLVCVPSPDVGLGERSSWRATPSAPQMKSLAKNCSVSLVAR